MGFRVTTAVATEVVSLTEAKAHLRVDDSASDDYIAALITAAREFAEHRTERSIGAQSITLTADAFGRRMELQRPPVSAISSVRYYDTDNVQQTVSSGDYRRDDSVSPAVLEFDRGYALPGVYPRIDAVQILYTAGYTDETVPLSLKQWMLLAIGSMFEQRSADDAKPPQPAPWVARLLDAHCVVGA